MSRRLIALAGIAAVSSVMITTPVEAEPKGSDSANGKLIMVMDSSGSMKEKTSSGETRIDAAKQALNNVIDKLPAKANVGLRVYGAKIFKKTDPGACSDSQLVVPVGPADKPALKREVQKYRPYGETPISYSLRQAAKDLGARGQRTIVLVSDGEPTCKPDPCDVAAELAEQGIDLKIDVVGLDVTGKARRQLQCVADKGNGVYYDAKSSDELALSLTRTSLRAFRPFTVAGKPIEGTRERGTAPKMAPGQYTDKLGAKESATGVKHYRLPYSKGSTMHVAVTARPPKSGDDLSTDGIQLKLYGARSGADCGFGGGNRVDTRGSRSILNATLMEDPSRDPNDDCKSETEFILEATRKADSVVQEGESTEVPIELVYNEEPPVRGVSSLPGPYDREDLKKTFVNAKPSDVDIIGGASFNDAAELKPGTVNDTLQSGEMLFYKVKADWGQAPAVTFAVKADPRAKEVVETADNISVDLYGPDRHKTGVLFPGNKSRAYDGRGDDAFDVVLPPVRYRNREAPGDDTKAVSRAGYYYFAISLGHKTGAQNYELPMTISTQLGGEKGVAPQYTKAGVEPGGNPAGPSEPSPTATRATGSMDSSPGSSLPLILGLVAAVVVVGGVGAFLIARRRGGGLEAVAYGGQGQPPWQTPQGPGGPPQGPPPQGPPHQGPPPQGPPPQGPPRQGPPR